MHRKQTSVQVASSISVSNLEAKTKIISQFPKIELFNETLLHQKVQNADLYIATPYGTKFFAWITTKHHVHLTNTQAKDEPICLFIESGTNTYLPSRNIFYIPLNSIISNWTNHYIFHGVLFHQNPTATATTNVGNYKETYFAMDHVYDFKTSHISGFKTFSQMLQVIKHIFTNESLI